MIDIATHFPAPTHLERIGLSLDTLIPGTITEHETHRMFQDFDNVLLTLLSMNTQPGHIDYEFAAKLKFGKPLVVSPYLASTISALFFNDVRDLTFQRFEIQSLSFISPIFPGTTVSCRSEILERDAEHWKVHLQGWKTDGTKFCEFDILIFL